MMNMLPRFGLQPHTIHRFGQNNPFVLGVPGMGGFGMNKKRKAIPLGLPQGMRPPMKPQMQFRNPFMGQMRPY